MKNTLSCCRDVAIFLLPAALIGICGSLVRYLRKHRHERFLWGAFLSGLISAAFASVLTHCLGSGLGLPPMVVVALDGMAGYSGGKALDLGQEALFRWISRRGK